MNLTHIEDGIDSEHLDQVLHSTGYKFIQQRMIETRDAKLRELVQPSTVEETARLRGWIQCIETCLRIPEILRDEYRAKEHAA